LKYIETSAKDNINVEKAFKELATTVLQLKSPQANNATLKVGQTVVISPQSKEEKQDTCAC
jgi:GTPase SAR1 family protein